MSRKRYTPEQIIGMLREAERIITRPAKSAKKQRNQELI